MASTALSKESLNERLQRERRERELGTALVNASTDANLEQFSSVLEQATAHYYIGDYYTSALNAMIRSPSQTRLNSPAYLQIAKTLASRADLNTPREINPLRLAVSRQNLAMVKILVEHGADPLLKDHSNTTVLEYAKEHSGACAAIPLYLKSAASGAKERSTMQEITDKLSCLLSSLNPFRAETRIEVNQNPRHHLHNEGSHKTTPPESSILVE